MSLLDKILAWPLRRRGYLILPAERAAEPIHLEIHEAEAMSRDLYERIQVIDGLAQSMGIRPWNAPKESDRDRPSA